MQKESTWLEAKPASELLGISIVRLAQLMRTRLISFVTAIGGPLFNALELKWFASVYPELLESFRVENEVEIVPIESEQALLLAAYPPDYQPNQVVWVKRAKGSIPIDFPRR